MRFRIALLGIAVPAAILGQTSQDLPRFRAGTNLVRVDAYVSLNGTAVTDLKIEDFVVHEDDKPQAIENFQLITAPLPTTESPRTDSTNTQDMRQDVERAARVFTFFFDRLFVSIDGSYRAQKPIVDTLERLVGPDDLVGVMTPEMSPGSITYSRRTESVERMVTDGWHWGKRGSKMPQTPQEDALVECYGVDAAAPLIARLREQQTLDALRALVIHLEGLRPERKFVLVFTEGWPLYRPDDRLAGSDPPRQDPIQVDPRNGRIVPQGGADARSGGGTTREACDRQRTMLAYIDHEVEFRELLQRANRANVSFYPIDARGLIVFDTPIDWGVPPTTDAAWLRDRQDDLRMMALQTDGQVVLNTTDVSGAMQKMFADIGSYYLLSYYSTNAKLDGRFRRIRVEVKRPDVEVRARLGYLAPTESEARAAGVPITSATGKTLPPPTISRALDSISSARGNLPVRIQAAGAIGTIRAVVELDTATARQQEWLSGGTLKVTFEPERLGGSKPAGSQQILTLAVDPGQRSIAVDRTEQPLAPGRYSVRAELTPHGGRMPIQVTTFATVPADSAGVGTGALASRRGPSTGLSYVATADPRFRRTERLRLDVLVADASFTAAGRVLTREGQPLPIIVTTSTRSDAGSGQTIAVADISLAPLAAGDYVAEVSITRDGKTEAVSYGFRIVP